MAFLVDETEILKPEHFFDLSGFEHKDIFNGVEYVWEVFGRINDYIGFWAWRIWSEQKEKLGVVGYAYKELPWRVKSLENSSILVIGKRTIIAEPVSREGPMIIGKNCRIGPFARLRGPLIIGDDCIVGNFTEIKNSILLNGARAPHHNYVGDSIVGNKVNLGSGVKLANYRLGGGEISARIKSDFIRSEIQIKTGRDKFGAAIGDRTEIGCNSVLAPGTLVGKDVYIDSLTNVNIYIPSMSKVRPKERIPLKIEPRLR